MNNKQDITWWTIFIVMLIAVVLLTPGCAGWHIDDRRSTYEKQRDEQRKERAVRDYEYKKATGMRW